VTHLLQKQGTAQSVLNLCENTINYCSNLQFLFNQSSFPTTSHWPWSL